MYSIVNIVRGRAGYQVPQNNTVAKNEVWRYSQHPNGSYYVNHEMFSDLGPRTDAELVGESPLFQLPF